MQKLTFNKKEKLCSKKLIEHLFNNPKNIKEGFIKVLHKEQVENITDVNCQVLISVSKKKIKKAVDRNLLKRRIREVYRLNSFELKQQLNKFNKQISIAIIYQSNEVLEYKLIESKIILSLHRLAQVYGEDYQNNFIATN